MLRIRAALASLSLCAASSACAAQVQNKEGMLVAAGVTLVPANTPQRQASLASLPPHKFVDQERSNAVIFTYADPTICDCLYVGNQASCDRYRPPGAAARSRSTRASTVTSGRSRRWF